MPRPRHVLVAFAVALATFAVTHFTRFPGSVPAVLGETGGEKIFDMEPAGSSDAVYQRLERFGTAGRSMYERMIVTVDVVFPVTLLVFLFLMARLTARQAWMPRKAGAALQALPIAYFLLDLSENLSILVLLRSHPERLDTLAAMLAYLTRAKRIAMMAALFLPGILWASHRLWARPQPS